MAAGILIYRRSRRLLRNGRRAAGQVVGREWVHGRDGGNYFPVIQFHNADGQEVRIRGPVGGLPVRVGKHVRVNYDPGNPRNGTVDSLPGRGKPWLSSACWPGSGSSGFISSRWSGEAVRPRCLGQECRSPHRLLALREPASLVSGYRVPTEN